MRAFWTLIHRWTGLTAALFLIVAGLTGAVTSWDHELDEWLNADIMSTPGRGELRDPLALAAVVEAADPRVQVSYISLGLEEGHAASFLVRPLTDPATGKPAKDFVYDRDNGTAHVWVGNAYENVYLKPNVADESGAGGGPEAPPPGGNSAPSSGGGDNEGPDAFQ